MRNVFGSWLTTLATTKQKHSSAVGPTRQGTVRWVVEMLVR
jgi:hypothetical protein